MRMKKERKRVYSKRNKAQIYRAGYVMEEFLGRKLSSNEVAHHIDHDPLNDVISNLRLMNVKEHRLHHSIIANLCGRMKLMDESVKKIDEMLRLYQEGMSYDEIAVGFEVPKYTVMRHIFWRLYNPPISCGTVEKKIKG